jgi:hypothetical protein
MDASMSGWRKKQILEHKENDMSVNISMDDFEELMNESNVVRVGKYSFGRGTILRRCDPVAFHVEYCTYCASVEEAMDEE